MPGRPQLLGSAPVVRRGYPIAPPRSFPQACGCQAGGCRGSPRRWPAQLRAALPTGWTPAALHRQQRDRCGSRFLGLPVAITASAGGVLPLVLLAGLDRRRWRAMLAGYGWGGTPAEVSAVAAELLRRGVVANVEVHDDESTSLRYRNADAHVVSMVLAELGCRPLTVGSSTWALRQAAHRRPGPFCSRGGDDG